MACIDHRCEECGEIWSDNILFSSCLICGNVNQGCWDEEKTQYIADNYASEEIKDDRYLTFQDLIKKR